VHTEQRDSLIRTLESDNHQLMNSVETLEADYSSLNKQLDEIRQTSIDDVKTMKLLLSDKDEEIKLAVERSCSEANELQRKLDQLQLDSQQILGEKSALADKVLHSFCNEIVIS